MTRIRLLLLLSFLVACDEEIPVLDQRDGGGRDASTPAEADAGRDAGETSPDTGAPDAGSEDPLRTQARERAESFCTYFERCAPYNFAMAWFDDVEECVRRRLPVEEDQLRRGYAVADPEACRMGADLDCDGRPDDPELYERCVLAPGPRAEGESCSDSFECGLSGDGRRMECTGCDGVCRPFLREGESCMSGPGRCDEERGYFCTPSEADFRCQLYPRVGVGEPCEEARCPNGYECHPDTGLCTLPPALGEECRSMCAGSIDVICAADDTGASERRCRTYPFPVPPGEACVPGDFCQGYYPCPDSGVCPRSCLEGLRCLLDSVCDPDTGRCEADLTCRDD